MVAGQVAGRFVRSVGPPGQALAGDKGGNAEGVCETRANERR